MFGKRSHLKWMESPPMDKDKRRFLEKVKLPHDEIDDCWEWTAARTKPKVANPNVMPYGQFWYCGKTVSAHRASYLLFVGAIPRGKHVMHECDNPLCVNPKHLKLGYPDENIGDKIQRGRHWKKGTVVQTPEMADQAAQAELHAKIEILHDLHRQGLLSKEDLARQLEILRSGGSHTKLPEI